MLVVEVNTTTAEKRERQIASVIVNISKKESKKNGKNGRKQKLRELRERHEYRCALTLTVPKKTQET